MTSTDTTQDNIERDMLALGERARAAATVMTGASEAAKNAALMAAAASLRANEAALLDANKKDLDAAAGKDFNSAFVDRLTLNPERVEGMAKGMEDVAGLPDPVGSIAAEWDRPNGLKIARVRTPLGVIGIIYESRPNVTADAGALCLKSGNAAILRGGSESFHTSRLIGDCLRDGLREAGLPEDTVQLVPTTDRAAVGAMLRMNQHIDIIVPRGGKGLIARVQEESRVPVIAHLDGNCHVYVDAAADLDMARTVTVNAKTRRPGVCGAAETLLVDKRAHNSHLAPIVSDLIAAGVEVRGDDATTAVDPRVVAATDEDWDTEYLDWIMAVKLVDGVDGAIDHIAQHGSHHTDAIVTEDAGVAEKFLGAVDSAIVLWNASTQFADGGEFGMGAEIGISTGKLHARGPVGLEQLTSFKYVVRGDGQVRP